MTRRFQIVFCAASCFCVTAFLSGRLADWKAAPGADFPLVGGDYANTRYSTLTRINKSNIGRLGGAWMVHVEGGRGGLMQATPVVVGGTMYLSTGHISARDARTGALKWEYPSGANSFGRGTANRGVVVAEGKVFSSMSGNNLIALDEKTGDVVWQTKIADRGNTNAPAVYHDGLVYMGVGGGESGVRGQFGAYDAKTGKEVWKFWTIPGPGELGHETWEGDSWKYGGAPVWTHPAIDPDLGTVYIATGNAGPDNDGTKRGGDNLFTVSVVALDLKTGKYKWHFQEVHHDLWDYDGPSPVILFDVRINGRVRKAAAEANKAGWVYILDRTNGKPLIGIDEKPVPQEPRQRTSPTQPIPRGDAFVPQSVDIAPEGFPLVNQGRVFTPFWKEPIVARPGARGGANWPPSSYDPATNYFYVCATDAANVFRGGEDDQPITPEGTRYIGSAFGGAPIPASGIFAALDMKTNRLVWQQRWRDSCYSGSVTTAGGLVFVGRNDGRLTALHAATGARLWEFQTGAGLNAPASVFEYEGQEYVVAYSAGSLFAGSPRGDSVWLFSLSGTLNEAPAASAAAPPAAPAPVAAEHQ